MGEPDNILYADDFCIIRSHTAGKVGIQTGREPETDTPTVVSVDDILPVLTPLATNMNLHDAIHERLVVDEPDHEQLLAAVEGTVQIVRGRYRVLTTDAIHERPPVDRVLTYLLGRYCAERLSDGAVSAQTDRADLIDRFGRDVVDEALGHGWIEHWDTAVRIKPRLLDAAAAELADRYGDSATDD